MPRRIPAALAAALTCSFAGLTAQFMPYGQPCNGALTPFTLFLSQDQSTAAGRATTFRAHSLPVGAPAALLVGLRRNVLGIDLTPIGATNCFLYNSADIAEPMVRSGLFATLTVPLPQLHCTEFYVQAAGIWPGANRLGVSTTNGATVALDPVAKQYTHVASASNIASSWTRLDSVSLDGEPGALAFVTQLANPGGSTGFVFNRHEVGVWYHATGFEWGIINQDLAAMTNGAGFFVIEPNSRAVQFTHRVDITNRGVGAYRTFLDHPRLNGNSNAKLFVTPVLNPGGQRGNYNDHPVGVYYDPPTQRWEIFNEDRADLAYGTAFYVLLADQDLASTRPAFTHVATAASTSGSRTLIDDPALNGNPAATLMVTQNWSPRGVYNPHSIGVFYDLNAQRWGVFNIDLTPIPTGAAFNVLVGVPLPRLRRFVHDATPGNTQGNTTFLSNAFLNGDENAVMFTTQNWNPGGSGGTYNPHATGVFYSTSRSRWAIFNQSRDPMPVGASFNILMPNSTATTFVATSDASNTTNHILRLDHPALNGNPDALIFVEQLWNLPGRGGVYNNANIGVYYNGTRWTIFNQSALNIAPGVSFRVLVVDENLDCHFEPYLHTVTPANSSGSPHVTVLDHPALNGNPNAQLTVTQNYSPNHVHNDHPIGVYYNGSRWAIFNQDRAPLTHFASFNVLINEGCF